MSTLSDTQAKQTQKEAYIKQMMAEATASAVQKDTDLSPLTSTAPPIICCSVCKMNLNLPGIWALALNL